MNTTPTIEKLLATAQAESDKIIDRKNEIDSTITTDRETIAAFDRDAVSLSLEAVDTAQRRLASFLEIQKTFESIAIENRITASDDAFYLGSQSEFETAIYAWLIKKEKIRVGYRKLAGKEMSVRQDRKFSEELTPQEACDLDFEIDKLTEDAEVRDSYLTAAKNKLAWLCSEPTLANFKSALCDVANIDFTSPPNTI